MTSIICGPSSGGPRFDLKREHTGLQGPSPWQQFPQRQLQPEQRFAPSRYPHPSVVVCNGKQCQVTQTPPLESGGECVCK